MRGSDSSPKDRLSLRPPPSLSVSVSSAQGLSPRCFSQKKGMKREDSLHPQSRRRPLNPFWYSSHVKVTNGMCSSRQQQIWDGRVTEAAVAAGESAQEACAPPVTPQVTLVPSSATPDSARPLAGSTKDEKTLWKAAQALCSDGRLEGLSLGKGSPAGGLPTPAAL